MKSKGLLTSPVKAWPWLAFLLLLGSGCAEQETVSGDEPQLLSAQQVVLFNPSGQLFGEPRTVSATSVKRLVTYSLLTKGDRIAEGEDHFFLIQSEEKLEYEQGCLKLKIKKNSVVQDTPASALGREDGAFGHRFEPAGLELSKQAELRYRIPYEILQDCGIDAETEDLVLLSFAGTDSVTIFPSRVDLKSDYVEVKAKISSLESYQVGTLADMGLPGGIIEYHTFEMVPGQRTDYSSGMLKFEAEENTVNRHVVINAFWLSENPPMYGYDFRPEGLAFNLPVELSYRLDPDDLEDAGIDPASLSIFYMVDEDHYEQMPTELGEWNWTGDFRLSCDIHHFSKYVIGVGPPPGGDGNN